MYLYQNHQIDTRKIKAPHYMYILSKNSVLSSEEEGCKTIHTCIKKQHVSEDMENIKFLPDERRAEFLEDKGGRELFY